MLRAKKNKITKRLIALTLGMSLGGISAWSHASQVSEAKLVDGYPVFQRAQDLNYGQVLYAYHQGNFFDALSALNVAKLRGGIKHHGQHPDLVEGGLMLSYGMLDEAKHVFDSLLKKQISPNDRNQAWYYLGKVFYLLENDKLSKESFSNIEESLLKKANPALYHELVYMKGQMMADHLLQESHRESQLTELIERLPQGNIWAQYLRYNLAIHLLSSNEASSKEKALLNLNVLATDLAEYSDSERVNLREQCLLSVGQIYLQQGNNQAAFDVLKGIRKDGLLADQALFTYSVAATNLRKHGLALEALTMLKERPNFTPWNQQLPYALAYLYEQMEEPKLALQAYRAAVSHYESLGSSIKLKMANIDEAGLLRGLKLSQPLGGDQLTNDAYGNLNVQPIDFSLSYLLASEAFQKQLSDLHELYKLEQSLDQWDKQLDSFENMMDTRVALRHHKIQQTTLALKEQNADQWEVQRLAFKSDLELASENEDLRFFMDDEQIKYGKKILKAEETLAIIPADHRKRKRYEKRLNRVKAYYEWWLSEAFSANRWRAVKEMRILDREMSEFHQHQQLLVQSMAADGGNDELSARVKSGRGRLAEIRADLALSLEQVRESLLNLVRKDYTQQIHETGEYLSASREAMARLSDQLYHASNAKPDSDVSGSEVGQ